MDKAQSSLKILVPLVEKFAEHLTAVDEAHDNQVISLNFLRMSPLIKLDELCTRTRSRGHASDSFIQFLSGGHCRLGPRQKHGNRSPLSH